MTPLTLVRRSLTHYRTSHAAVVAGVGVAVSVLAGALLVGESVRGSLRRLVEERLGNTVTAVESPALFRETAIAGAPLLILEGLVTHQASGRRATGVTVYGVDERFWQFHGRDPLALGARETALSAALAAELGAASGETLVVKIEKPSEIPAESLFGRKEDPPPSITATMRAALSRAELGEFSLRAQQGAVRALFLPLARVQRELEADGRVNTVLSGGESAALDGLGIEDFGLRWKGAHLHHASGMLPDSLAHAAASAAETAGVRGAPMLNYLANAMRVGSREIAYSLVAATRLDAFVDGAPEDAIVLNQWAAADLGARPGDRVSMEYYVWHSDGRLTTEKADFVLAGITPIAGPAADRDLAPDYPGITDSDSVSTWDPPFPFQLSKITDRDEDYWDKYRTTPKAFVWLARGQQLWASRWGSLTSIRVDGGDRAAFEKRLAASLNPSSHGFVVTNVRRQGLEASRGATNFGEYFVYFSFFLMVSALLLAGLFFRLGVEQRSAEVGLLQAVGFAPWTVARQFLTEGAALALLGGIVGAAGAAAYAGLILLGLGTWWVDAVGTRELSLEVPAGALAAGVGGGIAAALGAIAWTLRGMSKTTPRALLAGGRGEENLEKSFRSRAWWIAGAAVLGAAALLAASASGAIPAEGGFFGAGSLALIGGLAGLRGLLARSLRIRATGLRRLAVRNATHRPGRTVLSAALIASATFLIVSVEAFRRGSGGETHDRKSGTGGYSLMGETVRPVYHDPNTRDGRLALNLDTLGADAAIVPFRLRPGDDASCLNLYQPREPRVLGARTAFLREARFAFAAAEETGENPWMLLERDRADRAIPAIVDANSMTYVLHKKVGDEVTVTGSRGDAIRLRIVAALRDSVLQGELIVSERHFLRAFPDVQGYRVFLIEAPETSNASEEIENALADYGIDVVPTAGKLAGFHRVENAYLSTFQTLGGLGLLLGTAGLAAVLIRNVLERRRELALLAAVGYERGVLARLVLDENLLMLAWGLACGALAAGVAIAPVIAARGAEFSWLSMAGLLLGVAAVGGVASVGATWVALRGSGWSALRAG